MENLSLT